MFIIIPLFLLSILKYFEVSFMESVSWWWIICLAILGFLWFEFFERMLGLDKGQDELHHEKMRKNRVKRNFRDHKK